MDGFIIERIDGENVIRLSDYELARHGWKVGDRVEVAQPASGSNDTIDHDEAMRIARRGMKKYRNTLAELAK